MKMELSVTRQWKFWWTLSAALVLSGIVAMAISWSSIGAPLRPSLDFIGGTRLQLDRDCSQADCSNPVEIDAVREVLSEAGLGNSSIQLIGSQKNTVAIRTQNLDVDERTQIQAALSDAVGPFDPKTIQIDTVGPAIGRELFASGLLALIVSFVGIVVYLSLRFQLDYAVFAIVALFHDVFLTAGIFAILGLVQGIEVDTLFLVALLTIIGFSVNDTVVIYDRVRETLKYNSDRPIKQVVDSAVNQSLTRSINTTMTTLLPLVAIFLFGGETLKFFALALIIGFITGTYSSLFIASALLAWWRDRNGSGNGANGSMQLATDSLGPGNDESEAV